MKKTIITIILVLLAGLCFAQRFGFNKIQPHKIEWKTMTTMHFNLYFAVEDEEFGKIAALLAEKAYYYLKKDFKYPIKNKIPIIVYSSQRGFATTNIIYPLLSEGVGGFTELGKNRVVMPFDGSYLKFEEVLIHELTHAYVNAINSGQVTGSRFSGGNRLPFWFNEGLPEFLSIGGTDVYNNMFILDMVINAAVPDLRYIGGYYAYRFGESFLTYVAEKYSRQKVIDFFHAVRFDTDLDEASKKVFDIEFEKLLSQWKMHLKRNYSNHINTYIAPFEEFTQLSKNFKYQNTMNTSARISPDGKRFAFYSNKDLRTAIKLGTFKKPEQNKTVFVGQKSGNFEEFHFKRNNIAWLNNNTIAFVAKTYSHDNIYFLNVDTEKIIKIIDLSQFKAVFEIDINRKTNQLVFSAQNKMGDDIFVMNLADESIEQITNDAYHDYSPRFSYNGKKIVFSSEREVINPDSSHVFYGLTSHIYSYSFENKEFKQLSFGNYHTYHPQFSPDDKKVLFLTEENKVINYKVLNLENNKTALLKQSLAGVLDGDFNTTVVPDSTTKNIEIEKEALVLSIFFEGGWNVFLQQNPLENLNWIEGKPSEKVVFEDDLFEKFAIERWENYGHRNRKYKKIDTKNLRLRKNTKLKHFEKYKLSKADSLKLEFNKNIDKEPTNKKIPEISDYTTQFSFDRIWGGMAYSSASGAMGFLELRMSDLLGNHAFGIQTSLSGDLQRSNLITNYLYLKNKVDYAFGLFHINDADGYDVLYSGGKIESMQERERYWGLNIATIFPLNKYERFEFGNSVFAERDYYEVWVNDDEWKTGREYSYFVYQPSIAYVFDNSVYSSVGPISGLKARFDFSKAFEMGKSKKIIEKYDRPYFETESQDSGKDYSTFRFDVRYYKLFAERFALATRLNATASFGKYPRRYYLDEINGFRGRTGDMRGKNKFLSTLELRYPFLDRLDIPFPLPLRFSNVRGAAFVEAATAFDDTFELTENGRLKDLKFSFGFGPRLNAGIVIMKLDITWTSDFVEHGKPVYYFNIWQEF